MKSRENKQKIKTKNTHEADQMVIHGDCYKYCVCKMNGEAGRTVYSLDGDCVCVAFLRGKILLQ